MINEIKKKKSYSPEKLMAGAMWSGQSKPSGVRLNLIFADIVSELPDLEYGSQFELDSCDQEEKSEFLEVSMIAVCANKLTQRPLQCLPEPNAYFGCGPCELCSESTILLFHLYY